MQTSRRIKSIQEAYQPVVGAMFMGLFGMIAQPIDSRRLFAAALLITGGYIMVR